MTLMTPKINLSRTHQRQRTFGVGIREPSPILAPHRDVRAMRIPLHRRNSSRLSKETVHLGGRTDLG
jgi:hypothetical protein